LESEMFGHMRGAFTDAREARKGIVALAEGGTVFLDEIEALSPRAQVVLLRFLQDLTFRPLGADHEQRADVRIVAASNQDMTDLVRQRIFRDDLLYRLAVITVTLPPLRSRDGDALELAEHFLARFAKQYRTPAKRLSGRSLASLTDHRWPGNVRELENLVHRAFLDAEGDVLELVSDFQPARDDTRPPPPARATLSFRTAKAHALAAFERDFVARALKTSDGNVTLAAQLVGKERRSFGKLVKKYGIDKQGFARGM
jgi:two-component system, NtrC family, response regulator GlrR